MGKDLKLYNLGQPSISNIKKEEPDSDLEYDSGDSMEVNVGSESEDEQERLPPNKKQRRMRRLQALSRAIRATTQALMDFIDDELDN